MNVQHTTVSTEDEMVEELLRELPDGDSPLVCQSRHYMTKQCSIHVTHRVVFAEGSAHLRKEFLVCAISGAYVMCITTTPGHWCAACGVEPRVCTRVHPV